MFCKRTGENQKVIMESSYSYSLPYIAIFCLLFVLACIDIHKTDRAEETKTIRGATFVLLLIFFGLRGFIQTDWISYYTLFEGLPTVKDLNFCTFEDYYMEPGFILYSIIIKSIVPNYFVWVFINTLIDLWIFHLLFKHYSKYYSLSFLFFYLFLFMVEVNLYRNIKSIILFLLSLQCLQKKRTSMFVILNACGCLFHISSLVYIVLYPFFTLKLNKYFLWTTFVISNVIFLFHFQWASGLIEFVSSALGLERISVLLKYISFGQESSLSIGYLERCFTFIIIICLKKRIVRENYFRNIVYNCLVLYFIFFYFFSEFETLSERFSALFIFSYCFIYPWLFESLRLNKIVFICLLFSYGFIKQITGNHHILSKYSNLIWGVDSFEEREKDFYIYYYNTN